MDDWMMRIVTYARDEPSLLLVNKHWHRLVVDMKWKTVKLSTRIDWPIRRLLEHLQASCPETLGLPSSLLLIDHIHLDIYPDCEMNVLEQVRELLQHISHATRLTLRLYGLDELGHAYMTVFVVQLPHIQHLRVVVEDGVDADACQDALVTGLHRWNLMSLDVCTMAPTTGWLPIRAVMDTHTHLHTLKLGFLFYGEDNVLDLVLKANLRHLRQLVVVSTNTSHRTSTHQRVFPMAAFQRLAALQLTHLELLTHNYPDTTSIHPWEFLQALAAFPALQEFKGSLALFNQSAHLDQPFSMGGLTHVEMEGLFMNANLGQGLCSLEWPLLHYLIMPYRTWTLQAITNILQNAPKLHALHVDAHGIHDTPSLFGALMFIPRPAMTQLTVHHLRADYSHHLPQLQSTFPNARLSLTTIKLFT